MQVNQEHLKSKGWTKQEIIQAKKILEKKQKTQLETIIDHWTYWVSLLIIITANLAAATYLIPTLTILPNTLFYMILIIIGASFGALFTMLITMMEHIEKKHHLTLLAIVPTLAAITFIAIGATLKANNPLLIGAVYTVAFLLPYTGILTKKKWN